MTPPTRPVDAISLVGCDRVVVDVLRSFRNWLDRRLTAVEVERRGAMAIDDRHSAAFLDGELSSLTKTSAELDRLIQSTTQFLALPSPPAQATAEKA